MKKASRYKSTKIFIPDPIRSFRYLKKSTVRFITDTEKNNDKANKSRETTSKAIRINQASRKLNKSSADLYSASYCVLGTFECFEKFLFGDSLTKNHYTIFVRVVVRLTKAFEIWSWPGRVKMAFRRIWKKF